MTVTTAYIPKTATGDGVTTSILLTWYFELDSELVVKLDGVLQTLSTHYTVTGAGVDAGPWSVDFVTAPALDVAIEIKRFTARLTSTDLINTGPFDQEGFEGVLDKLIRIAQENDLETNWQGAWVTGTNYSPGQKVSHNGTSYLVVATHTAGAANEPGTGTSWASVWDVLAQSGSVWLSGASAPVDSQGLDGDYYIQTNSDYYGPKASGTWAGTGPTSLIGAAGTNGTNGTDGKTWHNGTGAPGDGTGVDGDFYLDTAADAYYGPKAAGTWTGTGPTSLIGPSGPGGGDMLAANNLSDLISASTGRTNLGLGALAVLSSVSASELSANAVETVKILNSAITLAKMADMTTDSIMGRDTAGTGAPEILTPAQVRTILNVENGADVTDAANVAAAGGVLNTGAETIAGNKTFSNDIIANARVQNSKGADVASAAALSLGGDGNLFDITGTTTITSITTKGVGTLVVLHFDDALTLTHHATDLILPGAANITTAAGDIATFYEYATGDWRCTAYTRANGEAVVGGGTSWSDFEFVMAATSSGSTSHLLGAQPKSVQMFFKIQNAFLGYSAGDEYPVASNSVAANNSVAASTDATTVYWNTQSTPYMLHKSTSARTLINFTDVRLLVRLAL